MVTLITGNIPEEMKKLPQWVMWKLEMRKNNSGEEKQTKIPYQINGREAKSDTPNTWTTFEKVKKAIIDTPDKFTGIGFVFTTESGIMGVDFDHVKERGVWDEVALEEIRSFGSYWEMSQSGTGAHVYIKAKMSEEQLAGNKTGRKAGKGQPQREAYVKGRFFVVTGDMVEGENKVNNAQETFDILFCKWFAKPAVNAQINKNEESSKKVENEPEHSPEMTDDEIINHCISAKNSDKFIKLYVKGDIEGYQSHSDAVQGLCNIIAWYTQNIEQIDRLFRQSKLMYDKWNRIGKTTILKAINVHRSYYCPENKTVAKYHKRDMFDILQEIYDDVEKFDQKKCTEVLYTVTRESDKSSLVKQATSFLKQEVFCKRGDITEIEYFVRGEFLDYFVPDSEDKKIQKQNKEIRSILGKHCTEQIKIIKKKQDDERKEEEKRIRKEADFKKQIAEVERRKLADESKKSADLESIPENVNKKVVAWNEYRLPSGSDYSYEMSENGITLTSMVFDKNIGMSVSQFEEVSRTPFIISERTEQLEDGKVFYTIRRGNQGKQKEVVVQKTELQPLNRLKETLAKYDINVTDEMAKRSEEYISKYLAVLGEHLYTTKAITANGWNDDSTEFYCGNWAITENGMIGIKTTVDTDKLVLPFHQRGSLEGWVEAVTPVMQFNIARFMLYDGMSAPLRKITEVYESQMTALYGNTSRGKTGLSHLVGSTMGQPNDRPGAPGLEFPVGTSANPLVAHAAGMSDMVVDFEEATGEIKAKLVADTGYDIVNGTEKIRNQITGKNRNDARSMRVQVQVTCERPLREQTKFAGAQYRINDIGGETDLIPEGNGELVNNLKKGIYANYGYFFPLYIQRVIKDKQRIRTMYEAALKKLDAELENVPDESKSTAGRAKMSFALKAVAGYLCEEIFKEIGVPAKTNKEVEEIVNYFFKKSVTSSPVEPDWKRALRYLADTMISARAKFFTEDDVKGENERPVYKPECLGNLSESSAEFSGTQLTKILKDGGFSRSVAGEWETKGIAKAKTVYIGQNRQKTSGYEIYILGMNKELQVEEGNEFGDHKIFTQMKELIKVFGLIKGGITAEEINNIFTKDVSYYLKQLITVGKVSTKPDGKNVLL